MICTNSSNKSKTLSVLENCNLSRGTVRVEYLPSERLSLAELEHHRLRLYIHNNQRRSSSSVHLEFSLAVQALREDKRIGRTIYNSLSFRFISHQMTYVLVQKVLLRPGGLSQHQNTWETKVVQFLLKLQDAHYIFESNCRLFNIIF